MIAKPLISVVVPTFNERDNVRLLCERVDRALDGISYEIIFVDDSNDDTPEVIKALQSEVCGIQEDEKQIPSTDKIDVKTDNDAIIRLFHRENGTGLATAVIDGFNMAVGKYVAVMDADLQHPPEILRSMYAALASERCDFCIPSRFIRGGSDGGLNLYRKLVSGVARYIGKIMLGSLRKISDPTGGLFMFRRECIKNADLRPVGWKILIEVLAMAQYSSVCEIPYTFCQREYGESKLSAKVTKEYLVQVWRLRKRELSHKDVIVKRISPERMARELQGLERAVGRMKKRSELHEVRK